MTSSLFHAHALRVAGRRAAVGAVTTIVVACAPSDAMAPPRATIPLPMAATANGQGPQACTPDDKLIGRVAASTADTPGTWWRLTKDRFDALGVTDYKAVIEGFYGQSFNTLDDAIQYLIDGVAAYDANGNGYVCAFEVRGTRAWLGDYALYLFGISDDKHAGS